MLPYSTNIIVNTCDLIQKRYCFGSISVISGIPPSPPTLATNGLAGRFKRARVIYDYDAKDTTELSLMADEVKIGFSNNLCCYDTICR